MSPAAAFPTICRACCPTISRVELDLDAFAPPPVFGWLKAKGGVEDREMLRTFNCGFGMVAFAAPESEAETVAALAARRPRSPG